MEILLSAHVLHQERSTLHLIGFKELLDTLLEHVTRHSVLTQLAQKIVVCQQRMVIGLQM